MEALIVCQSVKGRKTNLESSFQSVKGYNDRLVHIRMINPETEGI